MRQKNIEMRFGIGNMRKRLLAAYKGKIKKCKNCFGYIDVSDRSTAIVIQDEITLCW